MSGRHDPSRCVTEAEAFAHKGSRPSASWPSSWARTVREVQDKFRDPLEVFQPVWAAVGRVASAYGGIESGLRMQLDDFLGETAHSSVVVHNLPTDTVIRLCERLLREIPAYAPAEPLGGWILKACRRAGDERASVAHGSWAMVERGPRYYVGVRSPARGNEFLRLSADEIVAHAETIARIGSCLTTSDIWHATPSPPRRTETPATRCEIVTTVSSNTGT